MEVVHTIPELRAAIARARQAGKSVGFVPTMGCLHEGHLSLIRRAKEETSFVAVSVFVNPTQFGPNEDFSKYPRTFEDDRRGCQAAGADLIFAPTAADFYPAGASTWVDVEGVSAKLCGEFRPGHFRGVATVVAMLFNAVQADVAVFGRKDLQQLAVIRRMVRDLHMPVRILAHETVREPNGVAMSSRNRYLSPEQLAQATAIPAALAAAQALAKAGVTDAARLRAAASDVLAAQPALKAQYCEIVDLETMAPVASTAGLRCAVAIACHLGATRLIDNADL
ncbi:MAG: pantoate--beta-alanine ligase [Opitutales bacterium]